MLQRAEQSGVDVKGGCVNANGKDGGSKSGSGMSDGDSVSSTRVDSRYNSKQQQTVVANKVPFKGIEDAAKASRAREMAAAKILAHTTGEEDEDNVDAEDEARGVDSDTNDIGQDAKGDHRIINGVNDTTREDTQVVSNVSSVTMANAAASIVGPAIKKGVAPAAARRKLRWHALVDSGMGRLGFKSVEDEDDDEVDDGNDSGGDQSSTIASSLPAPLVANRKKNAKWKAGPHRDTVSIIKAMCDAEIYGSAPIGKSSTFM